MKHIVKSLVIVLLLSSCGSNKAEYEYAADVQDEEALVMANTSPEITAEVINEQQPEATSKKKIIRDGTISIKVSKPEVAKKQIDSLVRRYNAYYGSENFYNNDYQSSYELYVRIPNANFDSFVAGIEAGSGEITNKKIDAKDVTAQYVDMEIRLNNKRNYLKRYNDLLKQAKSIQEILEIEEINRKLEAEIESAEGQLRYLNDQVNYSTLRLSLYKEKEYKYVAEDRNSFWEELKYSLSRGWYGFVDFVLFFIKIWPLWIILGTVLFFILRRRNKK